MNRFGPSDESRFFVSKREQAQDYNITIAGDHQLNLEQLLLQLGLHKEEPVVKGWRKYLDRQPLYTHYSAGDISVSVSLTRSKVRNQVESVVRVQAGYQPDTYEMVRGVQQALAKYKVVPLVLHK
jgi:hypothetical protein